MLRATSGLEATALIEVLLRVPPLPRDGRTGEVSASSVELASNRTNDSLGYPAALAAPESVVEVSKLLMY